MFPSCCMIMKFSFIVVESSVGRTTFKLSRIESLFANSTSIP